MDHLRSLKSELGKVRTSALIRNYIGKHRPLREAIEYANNVSKSQGVWLGTYVALYEIVRRERPKYVLECGTGKSTLVIAQAMADFCEDIHGPDMKLVSMEQDKEWYDHTLSTIPARIRRFVEIHLSPAEIYEYAFVKGTVYKEIPDYPYEFVFVDGPDYPGKSMSVGHSEQRIAGVQSRGKLLPNLDFVRLVQRSTHPLQAIVDKRIPTVLAYFLIFGRKRVKFFPLWGNLGTVDKVTSQDLGLDDRKSMVRMFGHVARFSYGDPF